MNDRARQLHRSTDAQACRQRFHRLARTETNLLRRLDSIRRAKQQAAEQFNHILHDCAAAA